MIIEGLALVALVVILLSARDDIKALDERMKELSRREELTLTQAIENETRISDLEEHDRAAFDPQAIADRSIDSVLTVESRSSSGAVGGSAFVVSADGRASYLLTNYHVIGDAWTEGTKEVRLLEDKKKISGTVVDVSVAEDLALIQTIQPLTPLPLATQRPSPGDHIVVIGAPFGLEDTVADGLVSAKHGRRLQISAPVSPGDSGGPVLNERGEVVAVIVAKVAGGGAENLSFGIPIDIACQTLVACDGDEPPASSTDQEGGTP
ncbi:MAG: trypsin-like peptidase domain-containing protein [Actinomycetota bacterium]